MLILQYSIHLEVVPRIGGLASTVADYQGVISEYNTYRREGLPPGPIASPVTNQQSEQHFSPETSNFFYFRADCRSDGYHDFAVTYEAAYRQWVLVLDQLRLLLSDILFMLSACATQNSIPTALSMWLCLAPFEGRYRDDRISGALFGAFGIG